MALFTLTDQGLTEIKKTTFSRESIHERRDIQTAIAANMKELIPDCLVIQEEFSNWEESLRRIDLLAVDKNFNLVVVELKRDESGAHMELQALRYAAMVSPMTFQDAVDTYQSYLDKQNSDKNAEAEIMSFCERNETDIVNFNKNVRIVLISADFSKEVINSVLWLNNYGLNISCYRLRPYSHAQDLLVNFEQIIPLPEAKDFLFRQRRKEIEEISSAEKSDRDYSKYLYKGVSFNKRNLALALMLDWIEDNKPHGFEELNACFGKDIHRCLICRLEHVSDSRQKRFHAERVALPSGEVIVISNQWSIGSLQKLISRFKSFGYVIENDM
ncbi:hypothetical protein [Pseudescherichia sp.]|uniref:hypothetical protein n=1 Tax=Pseudescherichia sp. TaxID=2055881 RepID=UPI0028A5EF2D|nr:hypothetical protein [Pseudescherichia sp.]